VVEAGVAHGGLGCTGRVAIPGDVHGQWDLGVSYENGTGVQADMNEAVKWYRKAAAQGHEQAQEEW
jgi:hypothetical protein